MDWIQRIKTNDRSFGVGALVTGLFLVSVGGTMYLIIPASVLPVVMEKLAIGQTAAGWIISVMFGVQVLVSVPAGVGIDRFSNRRVMVLSTFGLVVACVLGWQSALQGDYWSLMGSRVFGGVMITAIWNVSVNVIRRVVDDRRQATALGVFTASAPSGFVVAHLSGPHIVERLSWEAVFVVPTIIMVVGVGVFAAASYGRDISGSTTETPRLADFHRVLTDQRVWAVSILAFLAYSVYIFVNSWAPTYLTQELGLPLGRSGYLVALFPALGILSRSGGGMIADQLFESRRRPVFVASFLVTAPMVAVIGFAHEVAFVLIALIVAGFFVQLGIGLFYAHVGERVEPNVAATAIAVLTAMGFFGSFSGPVAAGALIETTGSYASAFGYAIALALLGIVLAWRLREP
jgi:nitrate/nitrite transporter NarK